MITKYRFGNPIETEAVVENLSITDGVPAYGKTVLTEDSFLFTLTMKPQDIVYGLGEANRGINKRGHRYVSWCSDDPNHTEEKASLYGAHNFLLIHSDTSWGIFLDYPSEITFDIGYTKQELLEIRIPSGDLDVYIITGESDRDVVKQFRKLIGKSYLPPRWAFGFQQSRWGYCNEEDICRVADGYRQNHLPLDAIYMDIDYMERYKDFTVDESRFPDLPKLSAKMQAQGIHLVPIIDAGVKIEDGYDVYEAGVAGNHFCKREDGTDFVAGVWPGKTHFPDVLNADARTWFGNYYKRLTDQGIDGFWNDMNEPAIFYSEEGLAEAFARIEELSAERENPDLNSFWALRDAFNISNSSADYARFYHNMNGKRVRHDKVHNLFGYNMTRAAGEALERICPDKRILLFSRSSYTGMHRYGGIWTGDNHSWWSHLLLNIKMMPSLNMCGYLYSGADLGGFGSNVTRDLLLRWLAFGIFTPLMRNHSALGTREQECYQFENLDDFRNILSLRYRLIPYLYSEFMKAAQNDDLLFAPLAFEFTEDKIAAEVEDQLLLGESIMVTPIYQANTTGRTVYLPEDMLFVCFRTATEYTVTPMSAGHHYITAGLGEVPLFIRKGRLLPLAAPCESTKELSYEHFELLGESGSHYSMYCDDGISRDVTASAQTLTLTKE